MPKVHELITMLQENYASSEVVAYSVLGLEDVKSECGDFVPDDVCESVLERAHDYADTHPREGLGWGAIKAAYKAVQS